MVKKRVIKNKFKNLTEEDWIETNEASKRNRDISGLTFDDISKIDIIEENEDKLN